MLVSLDEMIALAWQRRWLIVACVVVFTALAATAAYLMTPRYRAQVIMVPVRGDDVRGALSRQWRASACRAAATRTRTSPT
jgi:LPS O-antigen subunit length determinant protein (WzzB/FepE family)